MTIVATTISIQAFSANITFNTVNQPSSITSPTVVKGAGISGLEHFTPANGTFQIDNNAAGQVINTNISINNNKSSIPQIAPGSVGWSSEGVSTYTFTLSAGGNPGKWDPKQNYCVDVLVNGNAIGNNCTNAHSYWSPTIIHSITLSNSSKIQVNIKYNANS